MYKLHPAPCGFAWENGQLVPIIGPFITQTDVERQQEESNKHTLEAIHRVITLLINDRKPWLTLDVLRYATGIALTKSTNCRALATKHAISVVAFHARVRRMMLALDISRSPHVRNK